MKHTPAEMSGGQQQRVGIARAFAARPQVVFADEPTGNLDTKTTREIMELFLNFSRQQKITIVLVTHDRNLANYADRIVTIVDGAVVGDTPNKSLFDQEREEKARKAAWENDQVPPGEGDAPQELPQVPETETAFGEAEAEKTAAALEEK